MKKTQIIDLLRNIKRQKVSFLSIIAIAAIGMTTFFGIDYTVTALRSNGSLMYNRLNYRDIEVTSTLLLSEDDITALRALEGVADVEAQRVTNAKLIDGQNVNSVRVLSLTERINVTETVEGRLPESAQECAVEQITAQDLGISVGDKVKLQDPNGDTAQYLLNKEYTVTGIVNHPDHTNRIVPETPYVFVVHDAFDVEALDGCFMRAEVLIERDGNTNRFSDGYDDAVGDVMKRIDGISVSRADKRDKDFHEDLEQQLAEAYEKLDDAEKQLADARLELDEKTGELKKGEIEIEDAEKQLSDGKKQLQEGWDKLESGRIQLESARQQLDREMAKIDEGKNKLDSAAAEIGAAKEQLADGYGQIEDAKEKVRSAIRGAFELLFPSLRLNWADVGSDDPDDPYASVKYFRITDALIIDLSVPIKNYIAPIVNNEKIPEELLVAVYQATRNADPPMIGDSYDMDSVRAALISDAEESAGDYTRLSQACVSWEKGHAEYLSGLAEYRAGVRQFEDGLALYNDAEAQYNEGMRTYQDGLAEYRAKEAEYEEGVTKLSQGKITLADGRRLLEEGEAEYAKAVKEFEDGKAQLEEKKAQVEKLDPCRWISLDTKGSASFAQLIVGSGNFSKLKFTFSLMFILVGALVIFATVGKIVDEQRTQIGTTKALGFFNREIFAKYLGFGVSATVIGTVIGGLIAYLFVEPFMLSSFNKLYVVDISKPVFNLIPSLLALALGILLASGAVWLASTKLLRQPAIRLMLPKMPEGKKKSAGVSRLSLYSRLILLNMRSDLKRVAVTVVSIAGCCALVVIGLTIRSGLQKSSIRQFEDITAYDVAVNYTANAGDSTENELKKILTDEGCDFVPLTHLNATFRIDSIQLAEILCCDTDELGSFFRVKDLNTGAPIPSSDKGILVQRRIAESFNIGVGDTLTVAVNGTKEVTVRIDGVFENYMGRLIIISPEYYREVFKEEPAHNAFFVHLNGADADALGEKLMSVNGYDGITRADADAEVINASTSSVNTVVVLFILIAGILAGVVQLNLTNIYVLQKKPELIIMRVNGFTTKEVINYILRETVVTTVIGILLGAATGSVVAYSIIRTLEQSFFRFYRGIDFTAWAIGAAVTVLFTVIVNVVALRKTKDLKLTDAA